MNQLRPLPKLRLMLQLGCISLALIFASTAAWGDDTTPNKISLEAVFLQGQQHVERAELAQAALSLSRITHNSPYAKLLAGNIALQSADYDRAFLLLVPLQSNQTFSKVAAASLHASLSTAYEKQADIINALDQLIRRQAFLNNAPAISDNQQHIWQLLSDQSLESLISMRGESADTSTQGWVDLSLASKNQDIKSSLNTWLNSYADHAATAFARILLAQTDTAMTEPQIVAADQLSPGTIALILPATTGKLTEKAAAFQLGLQAALNQQQLLNTVKIYLNASNSQGAAEQYHQAKNDAVTYIIAPQLAPALDPDASTNDLDAISILDNTATVRRSLRQLDLTVNDESRQIAAFARNNSMQHILLLATDNATAQHMVKSFASTWPNGAGATLQVISIDHAVTASETSPSNTNSKTDVKNIMELRAQVNTHPHDMLLLAMSAAEAGVIRPYLDISTPTAAFSSVHVLENDNNHAALNAIRFFDMPFLLTTEHAQFNHYRQLSTNIASNELLRCFALGVDYLQLLIAGSKNAGSELVIDGLSGRLSIDSSGQILRQLTMAKFTYDAVMLENVTQN